MRIVLGRTVRPPSRECSAGDGDLHIEFRWGFRRRLHSQRSMTPLSSAGATRNRRPAGRMSLVTTCPTSGVAASGACAQTQRPEKAARVPGAARSCRDHAPTGRGCTARSALARRMRRPSAAISAMTMHASLTAGAGRLRRAGLDRKSGPRTHRENSRSPSRIVLNASIAISSMDASGSRVVND